MLNIFSFLKKKSTDKLKSAEELVADGLEEKPIKLEEIAIHTMPERFRQQPKKTQGSRATGLIIIGGGALLLIMALAFAYFYFIKKPAATVKTEEPAAAVDSALNSPAAPAGNLNGETPEPPAAPATTTEPVVLAPDNPEAALTATTTEPAPESGIGLIPSLDSDLDGLTDAEEIIIGTSTTTPDTDGDGYLDGAELLNLYDPASAAKLTANPSLSLYENKTFNYSALYPGAWQMSVNGGDDSVMFRSADYQFFQIIVQANAAKQTLDEWYLEQLAAAGINETDRVSGTGWQGIKNLDGLTVYLMAAGQNYIFTLAYNPGENNILDYLNIFEMMIKSFTLANNQ